MKMVGIYNYAIVLMLMKGGFKAWETFNFVLSEMTYHFSYLPNVRKFYKIFKVSLLCLCYHLIIVLGLEFYSLYYMIGVLIKLSGLKDPPILILSPMLKSCLVGWVVKQV